MKPKNTNHESRITSNDHYLAIDYGTRKSGLAYSVEGFVFGIKTFPTGDLMQVIPKILAEKHIGSIVLGMPYNIDGSISPHAKRVIKFKEQIEKNFPQIPCFLHDERLSSAAEEMTFSEEGIDGDIDTEAARIILIDFLEQKKK